MLKDTLAILDANIITLNPKQPRAQAIAMQDGKIVAIGSNREIRKHIGKETRVIDANNWTVIPGLVDCHVHMTSLGRLLRTLDLRNSKSITEIQRRLREYSKKNPEKSWIVGGRWDQEKCSEKRIPTRLELDSAIADKPVFITRVCGHIGVANTKALHIARISRKTRVEGGQIDLDQVTGEPNGILRENALNLVWKILPRESPEELETVCCQACQKALEAGLTGVHWLVESAEEIRVLQKLHRERRLPLRVYLGAPAELLNQLVKVGLNTGFGDVSLKLGFVKMFADGSLGAHTAALNEPYSDKPETKGIMIYKQRQINQLVLKAHQAGLQVAVHAIGDHAIEATLRALEAALKKHPLKNHRHRIEHCSTLNPSLIRRMKKVRLIASVQPHFIVSDFWVSDRLGNARARWVYPFKTLVRYGIMLSSGSDSPVEPISPILGIWGAVARKAFAEETLTVEDALKTYTVNAAYASFDEDKKGKIECGKLADLTVLSEDPMTVPPDAIRKIRVEMVIVDGTVVYHRK
jgi:predicted amidohydrolase YtcJ